MVESLIARARREYHRELMETGLFCKVSGIASNADKSSEPSIKIANALCEILAAPDRERQISGQSAGKFFEICTANFVRAAFLTLSHLRPGNWIVQRLGNQSSIQTSDFVQYAHLRQINTLISEHPLLATALGNDYMVAPDIVVCREPCDDMEINKKRLVIGDNFAKLTPLRACNNGRLFLHASISAKWTMRSDRSQNSRTEALNLIRNRKGSLPHIMVVTGEPLPSRIASLALGTGVYRLRVSLCVA